MMKKYFILAFILLITSASASSPEDVGAWVTDVVTSHQTLEPSGDFFRAVLFNSEKDACLTIQKVNLRKPNDPKVLSSQKLCHFDLNSKKHSLAPDQHQVSEISELSWQKSILNFNLSYTGTGANTPTKLLKCSADATQKNTQVQCQQKSKS